MRLGDRPGDTRDMPQAKGELKYGNTTWIPGAKKDSWLLFSENCGVHVVVQLNNDTNQWHGFLHSPYGSLKFDDIYDTLMNALSGVMEIYNGIKEAFRETSKNIEDERDRLRKQLDEIYTKGHI